MRCIGIIASGIPERSAAASSRRGASRRAGSPRSVAGRSSGPRRGVGDLASRSRSPTRPATRIGPVDPAQHRLRRGPVGGAVGPAVRLRRAPDRLAEAGQDRRSGSAGRSGRQVQRAQRWRPRRSSGVRSLVPRLPGRRQVSTSAADGGAQIAVACRAARPSMRRTASGGGSSATKWRTSLVARKRWVAGWSARKRRAATPPASPGGKRLAHHGLLARLMRMRAEAGSRADRRSRSIDQPVRMLAKAVTSAWV